MSSDSGQLRPAAWKRLIVARTVDAATPIRRAISRIGTPPTNFNRRTSRTWRMIVLSAGIRSLLWNSQRRGPESASRGTCHPERDHPGMVGDIISERWAELSRNGWAASFRNHGRLAPESARQRLIRGLAGPGKKNPGIHSIEVTFKRTGKFVRLKPSNHAYEKLARQAARSNRMNGLAFANCSAHSASITQARTIS